MPEKTVASPKTSPVVDPTTVSPSPWFYGWVMLPIAVAGAIATSPGQTYGISVFNESLRESLDLSHTELTGAYLAGTLLAAFPVLFVGALMDRFGIRRVMTVVVVLFGGVCMATSQVDGIVSLFVAFFFLRTLGQGALSLLSSNTLAMWFNRRLGMAAGIMSIGSAAAVAIVPWFIEIGVNSGPNGWRWTFACLGLTVWIVMLPLLVLLYRNRPEDIGQLVDGEAPDEDTHAKPNQQKAVERSHTLSEALATPSLWILLLCNMSWAMIGTAIMFNMKPLYEDRGLESADQAMFYTYIAISMAAMQFIGGWLADRVKITWLLFFSLGGMAASVAYTNFMHASLGAAIFACAMGAAQGVFIVVSQTVWARYYGRTHLGKIRGFVWTSGVAGSSAGPFIMGVFKDTTGSFEAAIWIFAAIYGMLTIAVLFAGPPKKRVEWDLRSS